MGATRFAVKFEGIGGDIEVEEILTANLETANAGRNSHTN
jgi:hypothetical protein